MDNLSVIIPAAGLGRRMKSYGPKALLPMGDETLLDRQLRLVNEVLPGSELVVVVGFEAERLRRHLPSHVNVVLNSDFEETNVARSVALGLSACQHKRALVIYGDLVFNKAVLEPFVQVEDSTVIIDRQSRFKKSEVGVNVVSGRAEVFSFGLKTKWAHIVYLAEREKRLFEQCALHPARSQHFSYEILNTILDQGASFAAVEPAGMAIAEVDSSRDISPAQKITQMGD